jgi:hypothetical protein
MADSKPPSTGIAGARIVPINTNRKLTTPMTDGGRSNNQPIGNNPNMKSNGYDLNYH